MSLQMAGCHVVERSFLQSEVENNTHWLDRMWDGENKHQFETEQQKSLTCT
jgi:hypothetical protein